MSAIVKMEEAYNCLINFRNNCDNDQYKKLIDIIFPMLYQENKHRLEISVGKKISKSKFNSMLSTVISNFIVGLDQWNNEPQLIIKDTVMHNVITLINLALINDLSIEFEEDKNVNFCRYNIYYNYDNEIDYNIHITIKN